MSDRITASLKRLFEEHRIVFWYDIAKDMRDAFDAADLDGVEKVEILNNQFGLKYRMLRQEPKQKFLVYNDGPEPERKDNWLLDLQLATVVFKADQAAIWLAELGLPPQFEEVVRDHLEFYRSKSRLEHLKRLIDPADHKTDVLRRKLAVCAGAEAFEKLSQMYQDSLNIPEDLTARDLRTLHHIDHFEAVDRYIIRSLAEDMSSQTVTSAEVLKTVRERRQ